MQPLLELNKLSKSFGNKVIYHNISFLFEKGCYAIVGQNGTGKTVLIEMLSGVLKQDAGFIQLRGVGNNSSLKYKQKLTYIPGEPAFFPAATGNDFLSFMLAVKKWNRDHTNLEYMIDGFKLAGHLQTKFNDMSLGTQKKLFLTTLALDDSELIIMDEPTNALDDESMQLLYTIIKKLSQDKIVILVTHDERLLNEINPSVIKLSTNPITELNNYKNRGHYIASIL